MVEKLLRRDALTEGTPSGILQGKEMLFPMRETPTEWGADKPHRVHRKAGLSAD